MVDKTNTATIPQSLIDWEKGADARWPTTSGSRPDANGYVSVGDVSLCLLGLTCQEGVRYLNIDLQDTYAYLGEGLRVSGNFNLFHSLKIHADDVATFVRRYRDHLHSKLSGGQRHK